MVKEYNREQTIKLKTEYKNSSEEPVDPESALLEIYDSSGEVVTSKTLAELNNPVLGTITYFYTIPENAKLGNWKYRFEATVSEKEVITEKYFVVVEGSVPRYCSISDVYRHSGVDSTVKDESIVVHEIEETSALIDKYYGRGFSPSTTVEEWIDIEDLDEDDKIDEIFLEKRPIKEIVSLKSYDRNGTEVKVWTADQYKVKKELGLIRLRNTEFAQQEDRVEVVYTYGYDSVPTEIRRLTGILAAMKIIIAQVGGTFDDVTSYSLPSGVSIGVGEPYTNMREAITRLEKERDFTMRSIGQLRTRVVVI